MNWEGKITKEATSREIKNALSALVDELETSYPAGLPPLIDLVCWHADHPTFLLREARQIINQRRRVTRQESENGLS